MGLGILKDKQRPVEIMLGSSQPFNQKGKDEKPVYLLHFKNCAYVIVTMPQYHFVVAQMEIANGLCWYFIVVVL